MTFKKRSKRPTPRWRRWGLVVVLGLLALLLVPPLQVLWVAWRDPHWSPMQMQRRWEKNAPADSPGLEWTGLERIPRRLIHHIWASEDQRFFQHGGFDWLELRKAVKTAREAGEPVRGSSTISMQCARTVFLWQGRSYLRKGLEAYYTFWMELLLSKQRILELYLNHIELGPGVYGVAAAARYHFGKPLAELSPGQMAALAAILPNPLRWSPSLPDAVVRRKIRRVQRLTERSVFPSDALNSSKREESVRR